MTLQQRRDAFVQLGLFIKRHFSGERREKEMKFHQDLDLLIEKAFTYNGWFTKDNVESALKGIALMLDENDLNKFCQHIPENIQAKKVAVIMAGNIPAVGFHDMMSVLLSGHHILIKVSSDDHILIPFLAGMLIYFDAQFASRIEFAANKLENFDAVIATGSNNSARHFEYYFGKYPHIIRKNRTSVAILSGKESQAELESLGKDIFQYFGLGCRNVAKLYVPSGYSFDAFFEAIYPYREVVNNKKYGNNYDYNRAIYLLDGVKFLDNNFLILRENEGIHPPNATLFYEEYGNEKELVDKLNSLAEQLQCIVGTFSSVQSDIISFGKAQEPGIFEFADGINTIDFLKTL